MNKEHLVYSPVDGRHVAYNYTILKEPTHSVIREKVHILIYLDDEPIA